MNIEPSEIIWKRVAEPQADHYDSLVALHFARERGYERPPVGDAPTILDGKVALDDSIGWVGPTCEPAPPDHPNVEKGCELVRLWDAAFTQLQMLTASVSIFLDTRAVIYENTTGSMSTHDRDTFGRVAATVNTAAGFAHALVHETSHNKLRALGIRFESAERIITNSPAHQYHSPIRYDCLRPMQAVFHAQYSFTHVAALDVEIINSGKYAELKPLICKHSLADKLPKLQFGLSVIRRDVEVDQAGADFMTGFYEWSERVLADGFGILDEMRIPPKPFAHPLRVEFEDRK
ncbi:MAG TPA: HEXXH motif-containing putative peptide modification protein [Pyrinomonadaceae bacterium]|jgi:HEXXH motif-containing protein